MGLWDTIVSKDTTTWAFLISERNGELLAFAPTRGYSRPARMENVAVTSLNVSHVSINAYPTPIVVVAVANKQTLSLAQILRARAPETRLHIHR